MMYDLRTINYLLNCVTTPQLNCTLVVDKQICVGLTITVSWLAEASATVILLYSLCYDGTCVSSRRRRCTRKTRL